MKLERGLRIAAVATVTTALFTAYLAPTMTQASMPATRPFQRELSCSIAANGNFCSVEFTVPTNRMLVIEYVNARQALAATGDQRAVIEFNAIFKDRQVNYTVPTSHEGLFPTQDEYLGSEMMKAYADPGSTINIHVTRNSQIGNAGIRLTVAGRLVAP